MMCIEPAGQRAESRHDDLSSRRNEAPARNQAATQVNAQLGMKMPGDFRPRLLADCLVAKDDAGNLRLLFDPSTAIVGKTWIMIADDPGPIELQGESAQQLASAIRQAFAAKAIVEAVAKAIEPLCSCTFDLRCKRAQGRMRIIRRKELAEAGEPARLLKMQIGDEQRPLRGPMERTISRYEKSFACERKGNH